MGDLTDKQQAFVREYLVDLNATQAAIRAGYSPKTANKVGPKLLVNVGVQISIQGEQESRSKRTLITADSVLRELGKLGFANMLDYITINGDGLAAIDLGRLTREQAAAITELTTEDTYDKEGNLTRRNKIKLADKRAALVDIGRHLGMFKEKLEISGPDGGAVQLEAIRERIVGRVARLAPADGVAVDPVGPKSQ